MKGEKTFSFCLRAIETRIETKGKFWNRENALSADIKVKEIAGTCLTWLSTPNNAIVQKNEFELSNLRTVITGKRCATKTNAEPQRLSTAPF